MEIFVLAAGKSRGMKIKACSVKYESLKERGTGT